MTGTPPPAQHHGSTVACVVVNFNGTSDTANLLASLKGQSLRPARIIVVDNGSTEDELELLAPLEADGVVILRNGTNLGFAGGCNVGIREAMASHARYILLLNNDTWAEPTALEFLVRALELGSDSAVCPMIVRMDDPTVVWAAGGTLDLRLGIVRHRLQGKPRWAAQQPERVDLASGCALLIRTEALIEVGLIPERWFLYFEDTEFCALLRRSGRTIGYVPQAVIRHIGGASVGRTDVNYFYYWRNYLFFVREWVDGRFRGVAMTRVLVTMAAIFAFNLIVGRRTRARAILAAGVRGLRGDWSVPGNPRPG